jgi:hypothetical protein
METDTRETLIGQLKELHDECPRCHHNPIDCQFVNRRMESEKKFEEYLNTLDPEVLWDMISRHNLCPRNDNGNKTS